MLTKKYLAASGLVSAGLPLATSAALAQTTSKLPTFRVGEWNNATIGEDLKPFRRAADAIEASKLDYTIIRPAWLTDENEVDYELTERDAPFKGTIVSRKSVADLIAKIIRSPHLHSRGNVGVNKPGTDGDKPYFM